MKLFIVINQDAQPYKFVNKECDKDNKIIQPGMSINLTLGQHGEGCDIPDCSGPKYFDDHHMEFQDLDGNIKYCFWNDDDKDHKCFYTTQGNFSSGVQFPGDYTDDGSKKAIIIEKGTLVMKSIDKD
ncbi:MAG: hypothetical protein K6U80_06505 [Firmicutes bacterium]|nr:hypothetical protein [Bacillota bacterium]